MTLLELVVVLALLGTLVALVVPAPAPGGRKGGERELAEIVRAARSAALARAEVLELVVVSDGRYWVRPVGASDSVQVAAGTLRDAFPLRLQITPLGACVPTPPLPAAWAGWDAAACRPDRPASSNPSRGEAE